MKKADPLPALLRAFFYECWLNSVMLQAIRSDHIVIPGACS
jgi:hypothetical protein